MLVTELIPGGDDQLVGYNGYLDEHGHPLVHWTDHKLRQSPVHFGVGSYVDSTWEREVLELGLRLLHRVGYRGFAHVEFKRDARDGRLKLIECNPRFSLAVGLSRASGLDVPLFTYRRLVGEPAPSLGPYRPARGSGGRGPTCARCWTTGARAS